MSKDNLPEFSKPYVLTQTNFHELETHLKKIETPSDYGYNSSVALFDVNDKKNRLHVWFYRSGNIKFGAHGVQLYSTDTQPICGYLSVNDNKLRYAQAWSATTSNGIRWSRINAILARVVWSPPKYNTQALIAQELPQIVGQIWNARQKTIDCAVKELSEKSNWTFK